MTVFKIITTVTMGLMIGAVMMVCVMNKEQKLNGVGLLLIIPYIMALFCMWG